MKLTVFKLRYHVVYENGIRGGQTEMIVGAETAADAEQLVCDEAVQEANVTEVHVISSETIATDVLVKSGAEVKHDLTEEAMKAEFDKGFEAGALDEKLRRRLGPGETSDRNVSQDTPNPTSPSAVTPQGASASSSGGGK